jgi:hypothetical protein
MAFDIIPLSEFRKGKSIMGQRRRSNLLRSMQAVLDKVGNIDIIPQIEVDLDTAVGEMQFKQYNKDAIEAGFEGSCSIVFFAKLSNGFLSSKNCFNCSSPIPPDFDFFISPFSSSTVCGIPFTLYSPDRFSVSCSTLISVN